MPASDRLLARDGILGCVLAAVVVAVFAPALANQFVNWDDGTNFLTNHSYRGLGWPQIRWMLTSALTGHWIPVTWFTLGLDYVLWGMNPLGYHLTSILFHALGSLLFWFVALRLLAAAGPGLGPGAVRVGAAVATLAFAVHPLRAESVAWITERRDVVAGALFFATVLTHLKACAGERPGRGVWRAASLVLFALALGAKAIVAPLPLVLVVLDIYPLRRLRPSWQTWRESTARWLALEKLPYLALSAVAGAIALAVLDANHLLSAVDHHGPGYRIALATYGLWFYLWKTVAPFGLAPLYELPLDVALSDPPFLLSTLAVVALTVVLWQLRRRWPAGLAAWAAYAAILLPVSLRVHTGLQLVTDRYSYLACLGWALALGGAAACLANGATRMLAPIVARMAAIGIVVWLAGLTALTVQQVQVWHDAETLWRHAVDVFPDCATCYNGLGKALANERLMAAAIEQFEKGLAVRPNQHAITLNLVDALILTDRPSEAERYVRPLVERYPEDTEVRSRLVLAYIGQDRRQEAAGEIARTLRFNSSSPLTLVNLGFALIRLDRPREAIACLRRALQVSPAAADAHFWLAQAYLAAGETAAARQEIDLLRELDREMADRLLPVAATRARPRPTP